MQKLRSMKVPAVVRVNSDNVVEVAVEKVVEKVGAVVKRVVVPPKDELKVKLAMQLVHGCMAWIQTSGQLHRRT